MVIQWSDEKREHIPFPKQNSQSAHIWGWGGWEGDRAVGRPVRLHSDQCGECAVYRNPVQGTAEPGLLPTMHHSPHVIYSYVYVTFYMVCVCALQIGHRHVVDATLQEKACSVASLLISVTHRGMVTCVRKLGRGSLDPESIFEMTEVWLFFPQ